MPRLNHNSATYKPGRPQPLDCGREDVPRPVTISWTEPARATSYKIEVERDDQVIFTDQTEKTSLILESLDGETAYRWHVRAVNAHGESAWSDCCSFVTRTSKPGPFTLLGPADGADCIQIPAALTWQPSERAENYLIEIARDAGFTDVVVETSVPAERYVFSGEGGVTYYWRVTAVRKGETTRSEDTYSFTTAPRLPMPTLTVPAEGEEKAVACSDTVKVSWEALADALAYELQVKPDSASSWTSYFTTETSYRIPGVTPNESYRWRVRGLACGQADPPPPPPPPAEYVLSVDQRGGDPVAITIAPADFDAAADGVTPFTRRYEEATLVTATAPNDTLDGFVFEEWLLDGEHLSESLEGKVVMDKADTLTAVYGAPPPLWTLSVQTKDGSAVITVSPQDENGDADGPAPFTRTYEDATGVTLTAPDKSDEGHYFLHWDDGAGGLLSTERQFTVTMDANKTARAVFELPPAAPTATSPTANCTPLL